MKKLLNLLNKEKKLVVGLMSGTSIDGIDCALVSIEGYGVDTKITLLEFENFSFDLQTKKDILSCCSLENSNVEKICKLNFQLGHAFADAVIKLCTEKGIPLDYIDLVGSHGQTIYHLPQNSTLQIGEPAVIAEKTGIPVVADFRVRDVAAGGHGAPLVPYTEYLLYRSEDKTRVLQNIGGIGNCTLIPKDGGLQDVIAFDTGPGNMIMDDIMYQLTNGEMCYDKNGDLAAAGRIDKELLAELMGHPYMQIHPPKTTGREMFGKNYSKELLERCMTRGMKQEDIVATVTAFTAESIAYHLETYIYPLHKVDELIIGGGGSYNKTLIKILKDRCKDVSVKIQEEIGYSSDAKEAIAFAILANEALHGNTNNVPSVTGARESVIMGKFII